MRRPRGVDSTPRITRHRKQGSYVYSSQSILRHSGLEPVHHRRVGAGATDRAGAALAGERESSADRRRHRFGRGPSASRPPPKRYICGSNSRPRTGKGLFHSGARQQGSVLDWWPSDAAQGMGDGSYLRVLTVKDLQGRTSQRIGALSLRAGQASVQRVREQCPTRSNRRRPRAGVSRRSSRRAPTTA